MKEYIEEEGRSPKPGRMEV